METVFFERVFKRELTFLSVDINAGEIVIFDETMN